jgi:hypothetical protein
MVCALISIIYYPISAASQELTAPIHSISYELLGTPSERSICSERLLSDRQKASEDEAAANSKKSWVRKNWQPILGATLGTAIGFSLTKNYSPGSRWIIPSALAGTALGYLLGPGAMIGGYLGGVLGFNNWPSKIPVASGVTLAGTVLGSLAWDWIFAKSPLLIPPEQGEYLASQEFIIESQCTNQNAIEHSSSAYRVEYEFQGNMYTALLEYFPGNSIRIDQSGNALDTLVALEAPADNNTKPSAPQ